MMTGPVFPNVDSSNKYVPQSEHVSGQLAMTAPKYRGVDDTSKYNPVSERVGGDKIMAGPIYPGINPNSSYTPQEKKVFGDVPMTGPKYPGKNFEFGLLLICLIVVRLMPFYLMLVCQVTSSLCVQFAK